MRMDFVLILLSFFVVILIGIAVCLVTIMGIRIRTMAFYGGAPYVASTRISIENALKLSQLSATDRFADLGCGDGQVVLAAAKYGAREAVGFEIDPLLAREARRKIGKIPNASITVSDFWKSDLSQYDVIFLFQIPYAMPRLEKKLQLELKPGARVVSNGFKFPHWKPSGSAGNITLYKLEEIPKTADAV
jgi:ribosomal protein L11 methylase PrmA